MICFLGLARLNKYDCNFSFESIGSVRVYAATWIICFCLLSKWSDKIELCRNGYITDTTEKETTKRNTNASNQPSSFDTQFTVKEMRWVAHIKLIAEAKFYLFIICLVNMVIRKALFQLSSLRTCTPNDQRKCRPSQTLLSGITLTGL